MQLDARLDALNAQQLRALAAELIDKVSRQDQELRARALKIEQLTHEMALIKRWRYAARSEALHGVQASLIEEAIAADLEAIECELEALQPGASQPPRERPRRAPLPAHLPRVEVRHEPERSVCECGCELKRIGEDVSEKLDYTPGAFVVERHIRGKWACAKCERLIQAPVPAQVIDKGLPSAGLLAQVLVAKYADHQPLYRQQAIFERAGLALPRSSLAQWVGECGVRLAPLIEALRSTLLARSVLHADETPVAMLKPGQGKTHRAYLWSYCTTPFDALQAVVYDFAETRASTHPKAFLAGWSGKLVCDDYAGYKALFQAGIVEVGCLAHARRKFHELWANHRSQLAEEALKHFAALYAVEHEVRELDSNERRTIRELRSRPLADALHRWLGLQRRKVPEGSAIAKAIDYSLGRWVALTRFLDDGALPIDNNWVENRIRPVALGRSNWLFAGSLRAGQRAAAVMSLIQSARLNGHDPYRYLRDVLERLPTQRARRIEELLPHRWAEIPR